MNRSRALTAVVVPVLLAGFFVGVAATASPAAVFVSPTTGVVSVVQSGPVEVSWTVAEGVQVQSATVAIQASRPVGLQGCDPRWAPAGLQTVSGTSFEAQDLAPNRCYRFVLLLVTNSGIESVTSAPIIPAPTGWGATAEFVNPFVTEAVVYSTSARISWIEGDTFGSALVSRSLVEQSAAPVGESCSGVTWSEGVSVTLSGPGTTRALERSHCYRYVLALQNAAGFRSQIVSGSLRVADALPEWTGTLNLYRDTAFASQATSTWCVAASSQMMLNLVLGQNDTSSDSQLKYMIHAQANDGADYGSGGGSNPAGWAAALNRYGGVPYSVSRYLDSGGALKAAVTRMRVTNRPVGLLAWRGRHAWVMNGFEATADPATTSNFTVTAVYVSGPLYPRPINAYGYDLDPNTRLTTSQLAPYFLRYYDSHLTTWNGYWVIIQP